MSGFSMLVCQRLSSRLLSPLLSLFGLVLCSTLVQQVANEVGYSDARSFTRRFKNRFGKLPSHYIRGH